jgi:hypothetical protein
VRLFFLAVLVGSCSRGAKRPAADTPATVDVTWSGIEKGHFSAPATGEWCPTDSLLEITAIRNDTALGVALVAQDTLRPGQHPVVLPGVVVKWRPLARAALRWIGAAENKGFEATGGNVHVTDVRGNTVSGRIDVRMAAGVQRDTLRLVGTFTRVPMHPGSTACGRVGKGSTTG